jgi:hypothetical protein
MWDKTTHDTSRQRRRHRIGCDTADYVAVFNGSVLGDPIPTVDTVGYKYVVGFADLGKKHGIQFVFFNRKAFGTGSLHIFSRLAIFILLNF